MSLSYDCGSRPVRSDGEPRAVAPPTSNSRAAVTNEIHVDIRDLLTQNKD